MAKIVPVTNDVGFTTANGGQRKRKPTWGGAEEVPTLEYGNLTVAFSFFNANLFDNALPHCLITLQRKKNSRGYFSSRMFARRSGGAATDEVALNPNHFAGRSDLDILSTLVHEMVHLWQAHFGTPGRGRYHNGEWADKMESLGLVPSTTGQPGGARTGEQVSHYIIPGGVYDTAARALLASGFKLTWQSVEKDRPASSRKVKSKYVCRCPRAMWGQPGIDGWRCDVCESPVREVT